MCIRDRAEVQENGVGLSWADLMNYAISQFDKMNKRFDKQSAMLDDMINNMNKRDEKMERKIDTGKCNVNENNEVTDDSGVNTGDNHNGDNVTKNNEEIINEVS